MNIHAQPINVLGYCVISMENLKLVGQIINDTVDAQFAIRLWENDVLLTI